MGIFDRYRSSSLPLLGRLGRWLGQLGHARVLGRARAAELRGELAQAAALYAEVGCTEDAARATVLRGDAEIEPAARLARYVQAAALAPGSSSGALARRKRAELLLAMSEGAPLTATLRQDLREAAADLEAAGLHALAAQAWGRAGDGEAEARALTNAGDVDRLDQLLGEAARRDRAALDARSRHERVRDLAASGRRRDALALAEGAADDALRERAALMRARRLGGGAARVTLRGAGARVVLGDEVTVGRSPDASISLASAAVSRRHLAISRKGSEIVLRDLGGRNGTTLRGMALAGEVAVGERLEVRLGGEVPLVVAPTTFLPGAVRVEVGGDDWVAPLGPARLGIGGWALRRGEDGWIELDTQGGPTAFLEGLALEGVVQVLARDAFAVEREGAAVLTVDAP